MRIAMIGQKGFDVGERGGGIEQHVTQLARRLSNNGHAVTVYARSRYGRVEDDNVFVKYLPTLYRKNLEAIIHTVLATIDALFHQYDIIHYHGVGPATLSWIPRFFKRSARTVVTFHSQDRFHQKWGWFARTYLLFGEWASCWFPHATIAVSHSIQVFARKKMKRQVIYIPNGANPELVTNTSELDALDLKKDSYLLSVSRLEPHKGQWYIIEAFRRLEQSRPELVRDLKVAIVGASTYGDTYEQELKRVARGSDNIFFLGFQTGEALKQLFAHAKIFVHASEAEGLPVVVLEAMGAGTPVLVSDIPENIEAIHKTGFVFQNKDADDLKLQLEEILPNDELMWSVGRQGQDIIQTLFSWDSVTTKTEEVYRSLRH
jgi:glycosyltransferase involved in cell wall biosynthesis